AAWRHGRVPGSGLDYQLGKQSSGRTRSTAVAEPYRMNARREPPSSTPMGRLPLVRGRLIANAAIGRQTWFGVGGAAEILFRPADAEDLVAFLAALPAETPV